MFKNVTKLIDASIFKQSNNFILQHKNLRVCPASQLFNANESIGNITPFNASLLAICFSTQSKQLEKYLQLPGTSPLFQKECSTQKEIRYELSEKFLHHCYLTFKDDSFDIPFQGYSSFMKAAVILNKIDKVYFEKLMPKVLEKIQYADKQGLEDLMWVIAQLDIQTGKQKVINAWQAKNGDSTPCHLEGWKVDQYQQGEFITQNDIYHQYYLDFKNNVKFADQRHYFRTFVDVFKSKIINRIFFRETRIQQELSIQRNYDFKQVQEKLLKQLP